MSALHRRWSHAVSGLTPPSIFVAYDDEDLRNSLAEVLTEAGYRCVTAADGREAMQQMVQKMPDLLILDLKMPKKSGWEVLEAMRSSPSLMKVPVIIVSAHASTLPLGGVA